MKYIIVTAFMFFGLSNVQGQFTDEHWDTRFDVLGLNGPVYAIAVDGSNVYVGGQFTMAGNVIVNNVAKWNGTSWSALENGMNGNVKAIAISGTSIYVGGGFTTAGSISANHIAKWDGIHWDSLGAGTNDTVTTIAVSGDDIYAGGYFTSAGGDTSIKYIAKWSTVSWSAVGGGMPIASLGPRRIHVNAIAVKDTNIYVGGGAFYMPQECVVKSQDIAMWNGHNWSVMGLCGQETYYDYDVYAISIVGDSVYFTRGGDGPTAVWDGNSWVKKYYSYSWIYSLTSLRGITYFGGDFENISGHSAPFLTGLDSSGNWISLGSGLGEISYPKYVRALGTNGTELFVGGLFDKAGNKDANNFSIYHLVPTTFLTESLSDTTLNEDFGKIFLAKLSSHFQDTVSATLIYTATNLSSGVTPVISNDSLYLSSTTDFFGDVDIRITANGGTSVSDTFLVTVAPINDPPHIVAALRDTTFNENFGKQFVFKVSNFFADVDNTTLNYSVSNLNGGLSASISNDSLYLISEFHFFGEVDVQITGDDGSFSISDTFKITVQRTDFPPVPPQGLTAEALAGQVRITWNRNYESDFYRYFIYGGISPNPTALLDSCVDVDDTSKTIVGLTNDTTYYFRITATDLSSYESSYSDEISVTPAVLSNVNTQPVDTSTGSTPVVLTFSQVIQSGPVQLIISSTGPQIPEGMIHGDQVKYFDISTSNIFSGTITVSVNYSGIHFKDETAIQLFHYETDHWVDATVSVDTLSNIIYGAVSSLSPFALLQPANVSPQVSNSIPDTTVSEDFGKAFIRDLTGVFSDPDTPVLTFDDSSFSGGLSTMISGDSLYLMSQPNFVGSANIRVMASDSEFTVADTFFVSIISVNDPPIVNNPITDRLLNKNFGSAFVSELAQNFTDVDLFTVLTYGAINLSPGVTTRISDDSLYLDDSLNFVGSVLIRVTAFDGDTTVADTFQVNVLETAPSVIQAIRDTSFSEDAGTKIIADLSLIFQDIDSPSLTYSTTYTGNVLTSEIVNDQVQIVTVPDSFGVSTVIVTAEDELLQSASDTFTVTITPLNDAPRILVSLPDGAIDEDAGKKFIAKMSGTFSDPDGDMLIFSSSVSDTMKATTIISNDSLYVLTIKDSNGAVNVHVSATDPLLTSANDTFLLTINPFNDPPFITQLLRDTTLQQDFGRIFVAKLSGYFSDIDGDELFYNGANLSAGMSAETSNDSLYLISQTYFFGEVGILVEANDGDASIMDTFVVTVSNSNDAPMSLNWFDDLTINEDTSGFFAGGVNFNFIDVDNDILVYDAQSSDTTKIKVHISNDSLYVYPARDSSGIVEIYLTATDPFSEFVRDTFLITIVGVNDAPFRISSMHDTTLQQNFGKVFISRLNTVFADIDGPGLSYTATVSPTGLSTQVSGDSLYLNSILNYFGAVNVRVIANDGSLSASDTFRVTVADNNSPSAFVNALASPVLNIVRFVAGADENLSALTLSANGQPVAMSKQGNVYFGDYSLSSTGSLPVSVTATDLSGNQDTVNRQYQVSLLNKTTVFGKYQFSSSSEGYMLLRISESVTVPLNWKRYAENIDVVMTNMTAEIKIESTTERLASADEGAKLGLYEWTNGQWLYVGGEGSGGKVKAAVNKGGTYAVLYNPDHISIPKEFVLNQNFPNPFNPSTTIRYEVPDETRVTLKVYNLLGQEVRTLVDAVKGSGRYEIRWDGKNASGKEVASGVYLYRLQADKFVQTRKMLFIK